MHNYQFAAHIFEILWYGSGRRMEIKDSAIKRFLDLPSTDPVQQRYIVHHAFHVIDDGLYLCLPTPTVLTNATQQ